MLFRSFLKLPMSTEVTLSSGDTGIHLWKVKGNERRVVFANYQGHLEGLL